MLRIRTYLMLRKIYYLMKVVVIQQFNCKKFNSIVVCALHNWSEVHHFAHSFKSNKRERTQRYYFLVCCGLKFEEVEESSI